MSQNTSYHLNTLRPGLGLLAGATSLAKRPELQVWHIRYRKWFWQQSLCTLWTATFLHSCRKMLTLIPNPNTDTKHREAYQTVLLAIFVLCLFGTICSFPTNWLHRIILWFAPINSTSRIQSPRQASANMTAVIASICICIALLILTPNKQSPTWVFTTVMDGSGWGSKGFSFLLGFVYPTIRPTRYSQDLT
jgi:succinate dehydrogenase hydrophobic anchor subunit